MGLFHHIASGFTGSGVRGLNDRDFTAAAYRARGLFITLRMKVDQDTFGLNNRSKTIQSVAAEK